MQTTPATPPEEQSDRPPVLGNWRNVYLFVLALHVFIIYLFVRFGEAYV